MGVRFVKFLTNKHDLNYWGPIRQFFDELGKKINLNSQFEKILTDFFDDWRIKPKSDPEVRFVKIRIIVLEI